MAAPQPPPKKTYKLVLLGETAVGKTSLALRFARDTFLQYQESTIGAAFLTQTIKVNETEVKFEIWDTAGQERYHSLAPMYYRGAKAAIIVYDVTSSDSFDRAKKWIDELAETVSDGVVLALVGNKSDLFEEREVSSEEAQEYAESRKSEIDMFKETSAKDDAGVSELFEALATTLLNSPASNLNDEQQVRVAPVASGEPRSGCANGCA